MVRQNNQDIIFAWEALADADDADGWRFIPITTFGNVRLRAGRYFPGNTEALLLCFPTHIIPSSVPLPEGLGFRVERTSLDHKSDKWLALTRRPQGSLEMFSVMVDDITQTLNQYDPADEGGLFQLFLSRIRAWQAFMKNARDGLTAEEELGLVGELDSLTALLSTHLAHSDLLDWWVGPNDGVQDFEIGTGALEVKSTLSASGFPARIDSLDQLDDSYRSPIFMCGRRYKIDDSGLSLPERIKHVREQVLSVEPLRREFDMKLLRAGYADVHAERYTRKFLEVEITCRLVDQDFPRLYMGNIPPGIRGARYEIDLEAAGTEVSYVQMINKLTGI